MNKGTVAAITIRSIIIKMTIVTLK